MRRLLLGVLLIFPLVCGASAQGVDVLPWPYAGPGGGCIPFCITSNTSNDVNTASSIALTLPSAAPGSVVVVAVWTFNASAGIRTVSSVTSTSLTYSLLTRATFGSSANQSIEWWWASVGSQISNEPITVTLTGSACEIEAHAFSLTGAYNYLSPYDNNGSLPQASVLGSTGPPTLTASTSEKRDIILSFAAGGSGTNGAPAGFSVINTRSHVGGCAPSSSTTSYKIIDSPSTSVSYVSVGGYVTSGAILTAITADPALYGGGTVMRAPLTHW